MFQHLAALGTITTLALFGGCQNQIALLQALGQRGGNDKELLVLLVHRLDANLAVALADHAQKLAVFGIQFLDEAGFPAFARAAELDQQAVTHSRRRSATVLVGHQNGLRRVGLALDQLDQHFAIVGAGHHIDYTHGGQGASLGKAFATTLAELALGLQLAQRFVQHAPLHAL